MLVNVPQVNCHRFLEWSLGNVKKLRTQNAHVDLNVGVKLTLSKDRFKSLFERLSI